MQFRVHSEFKNFHSGDSRAESKRGLKLVLKMGLKNWNTNIRLQTSDREKWTTFPEVALAPFQCNDPKSPVPFTFQLAFLETF